MFSRNSIHPLACDGALFAHINGNHEHLHRCKSFIKKDKLG